MLNDIKNIIDKHYKNEQLNMNDLSIMIEGYMKEKDKMNNELLTYMFNINNHMAMELLNVAFQTSLEYFEKKIGAYKLYDSYGRIIMKYLPEENIAG